VKTWAIQAAFVLGVGAQAAPAVSVRSLLTEMSDLRRLSVAPNPPYVAKQASSYDRKSKSPSDNWFANADYGNYIRVEHRQGRDEYVMADVNGPGAVTRIWSANPQGTLRIYIDGNELPELIANMEDLLSGKHLDFPPPFAHRLSGGANLYYPIPYNKSLKVTVDGLGSKPGSVYYHVNYRTYPPGTEVRSFTMAEVKDAATLAARIGDALEYPQSVPSARTKYATLRETLEPGKVVSLHTPQIGGEVREIKIGVVSTDMKAALRGTLLEADFDGDSCISAPLGDFFATAPGLVTYNSLPMAAQNGVLISRWVMPQMNSGRMFFANTSNVAVTLDVLVTFAIDNWNPNKMHFKAKWRRETLATRPMRDWNFLDAKGEGRFVGAAMFIANPVADWWGEGDEKIYLDGEAFPSTFGTGTEDYFGYAWSSPVPFAHPYHNQLWCDGPGTRGYSAINRFQIFDDMPFASSYKFDMEIWHWRETVADFAVTAYWYAKPGATDTFTRPRPNDLTYFAVPEPLRVKGAIEGEDLKVLAKTGGETEVQQLGEEWSNFKQVWWRDAKPGDRISFEVEAGSDGKRALSAQFCAAVDYGIVQLYWNGAKLGEPIDFYGDGVKVRKLDLGEVEVRARNVFEAEIVGSNKDAVKRHMFALDYLLLREP
jgi:hypothetical protein